MHAADPGYDLLLFDDADETPVDASTEITIPLQSVVATKKYGGGLGLGLAKPFGLKVTASIRSANIVYEFEFGSKKSVRDRVLAALREFS
eukprot:SAG31_NODE_5153_length_2712_cov_2.029851_3_plen_90_part_00